MEHELLYDEENSVIVLKFNNHFLLSDVAPIFNKTAELLEGKSFRQVLIVTNKDYNIENRETREAIAQKLSQLSVTEIAFVGIGAAERMIARVLIKTVMKLNGEFFKDYNEALDWLKSKR